MYSILLKSCCEKRLQWTLAVILIEYLIKKQSHLKEMNTVENGTQHLPFGHLKFLFSN